MFSKPKAKGQKYCSRCDRYFPLDDVLLECPSDGTQLEVISVDFLHGQVIDGKYEIIELIGNGGWSLIYKAKQLMVDRLVAVKVLHAELAANPERISRFRQEAASAGKLIHSNIVAIHDYGILPEGNPYIVMDLVAGKTLAELLADNIPSWQDTVSMAIDVCEAMQLAHDNSIIHRDIKPSNIMITPDKSGHRAIVLDFGLAKLMSSVDAEHATHTGETVGTPLYMSPEQCQGLALDARTDIYSLGCVMYKMLTGKDTIEADTTFGYMYKHVTDPPRPFSQVNPNQKIPGDLEKIVFTCLEKAPEHRYRSFSELKSDLESTLSTAGGTSGENAIWRKRRTNRLAARLVKPLSVGAALLVVTLLPLGAFFYTHPQSIQALWQKDAPPTSDQKAAQTKGSMDDADLAIYLQKRRHRINFKRSVITDKGLALIPKMQPWIDELLLDRSPNITNAGLKEIGKLTALHELNLERLNIDDSGFDYLLGLKKLKLFFLGGTRITDKSIAQLTAFPELSFVTLWSTGLTDEAAKVLQHLPQLNTLQIGATDITSKGLAQIALSKKLKDLDMEHMPRLTDESLVELHPLAASLRRLFLKRCQFTDKGMENLAHLTALEDLDLTEVPISDAGVEALTKLGNLRIVGLDGTSITDQGFIAISKLPKLEDVSANATKITDRSLLACTSAPHLKRICIGNTAVTDRGLSYLKNLKQLREVCLTSCPAVTQAGIDDLKKALPQCQIF